MLYFVRHGQTNHNLNKLLAGRCDVQLNEKGIEQAKESACKSKAIKIDRIYCSPLTRAKQTCMIINKEHNVDVLIRDELIERDFGNYESKDYSSIDGEKCWNYNLDTYDNEIEPLRAVFKRVYSFLDEIKDEYKKKNILIVAHNDIGRAIYCYFNGIPKDGNLRDINMANADIVKCEWRNVNDRENMAKK